MKYNFDEITERTGTGCVKYDKAPKGLIPLWVADMDFRTPDFILDAPRLQSPLRDENPADFSPVPLSQPGPGRFEA